jgi:hypothetical protein
MVSTGIRNILYHVTAITFDVPVDYLLIMQILQAL